MALPIEVHPMAFRLASLSSATGCVICVIKRNNTPTRVQFLIERRRISTYDNPGSTSFSNVGETTMIVVVTHFRVVDLSAVFFSRAVHIWWIAVYNRFLMTVLSEISCISTNNFAARRARLRGGWSCGQESTPSTRGLAGPVKPLARAIDRRAS
jgi:hypothetical protein